MVRAILEVRKSQTRRVVKGRGSRGLPEFHGGRGEENDPSAWGWFFDGPDHHGYEVLARGLDERHDHGLVSMPCPFGRVGDRLWVRETWAPLGENDPSGKRVVYAAGPFLWGNSDPKCGVTWPPPPNSCDAVRVARWRPSIHMPRWASRLTLEVTGVRVERLNDISEEDAVAEGVEVHMMPEEWRAVRQQYGRNEAITFDREPSADLIAALRLRDVTHVPARPIRSAVSGFSSLWESINGPGSWDANPWVWAITFKRLRTDAGLPGGEVARG